MVSFVFDVNDETNHNSRLMLELFFDWTYNIQHTPMDIDENGTYNIKHIIYTDEYRWVLMRRGTYNIHRWISMNIDETRNIQQWNDEYRRDDEHMFQGDYFSSKNLEPIKLISFTNVSLVKIYYRYQWRLPPREPFFSFILLSILPMFH